MPRATVDDRYAPMSRDSSCGGASSDPTGGSSTILSVFWCGTAGVLGRDSRLEDSHGSFTTQVGLFFLLCDAVDISNDSGDGDGELGRLLSDAPAGGRPLHMKMGFDGCAVTHGCMGTVFAAGLRSQCRAVVRQVEQLLAHLAGQLLVLNVLGLSRGGIAAMRLTQALAHTNPALLELNLCLFDPVPGNLMCSGAVDKLLGGCVSFL